MKKGCSSVMAMKVTEVTMGLLEASESNRFFPAGLVAFIVDLRWYVSTWCC